MLKKSSARFASDIVRHVSKACFAAWTARSTSASVARSSAPVCLPVAGLNTGLERPDSPATLRPPIQWLMRLMSVRSSTGGVASSVMVRASSLSLSIGTFGNLLGILAGSVPITIAISVWLASRIWRGSPVYRFPFT